MLRYQKFLPREQRVVLAAVELARESWVRHQLTPGGGSSGLMHVQAVISDK